MIYVKVKDVGMKRGHFRFKVINPKKIEFYKIQQARFPDNIIIYEVKA